MIGGWMFERERDMVWVFLEDEGAARAKAIDVLGGEPTADSVMLPEEAMPFFNANSGNVIKGRIAD